MKRCVLLFAAALPSLSYKHVEKEGPLSIHGVEFNLKTELLFLALANDELVGEETTLSIAIRKGAASIKQPIYRNNVAYREKHAA